MRAEVRTFHSPDIPDLAAHTPSDATSFAFLLEVMAGPKEEEGEESFNVEVCTPAWLSELLRKERVVMGRHHLIVADYDWSRISAFITKWVASCEGDTWEQVALKVGRLGHWEFEDYVEAKP
ncbi:MAG: hypothetical protein E6I47_15995 [Chloroflexi bacterium]|nr:MAG: hypothetical protein E6I86_07905 [Chloroflexota bacterium]TME74779.1 MAG: hypothetical protein E6I47_15995 [Chloroflexota bacterium]